MRVDFERVMFLEKKVVRIGIRVILLDCGKKLQKKMISLLLAFFFLLVIKKIYAMLNLTLIIINQNELVGNGLCAFLDFKLF